MTLSFISDDGYEIKEGTPVYVQDKESGGYELKNANISLIERRLGICRPGSLDELQPDEITIHWNYFLEEKNVIERKIRIETKGPDDKYYVKKLLFSNKRVDVTAFSHTGNIGDCHAAIPAMRQHFINTGKKIDLYLFKNVPAVYYEGAVHPTKDENGVNCMLNQKMIDMMIPLLKAQSFINEVYSVDHSEYDDYKGKIKVHLEWFRENNIGLPNFSINRWYFYVFPDLTCDLSKRWLEVPVTDRDIAMNKVIITRSERYTNPTVDYSFLKPYEDEILFCGTQREWNNFCMSYDLNVRKLNINNFLELAQALQQCRFHITNQTQAFQLSEGQKVPRILELCTFAANCIPIGENAYDFHNQLGLEYAFHKLNGTVEAFFEQKKAEQENKKEATT